MRDDGGQAFPMPVGSNGAKSIEDLLTNEAQLGMTLRDYFAAKALQGLVAAAGIKEYRVETMAEAAYEQADAMLKARTL